jgi:hypothetical protein
MSEFKSRIPYFLDEFLTRPATAIPKGAQWVLQFDDFTGPVNAIKKALEFEPLQWNIETALEKCTEERLQNTKGCLFAQAIQLPGESMVANPEGLQYNGFLRTTVGGGRDAYTPLQIVFLDTNVSFADNVIRPWVIATAHYGLVATKEFPQYRTNFTLYRLGVISRDEPPHVTQKYTFYDACPVSVVGEEFNYSTSTTPRLRETTFVYHYYTIDSVTDNQSLSRDDVLNDFPIQNFNGPQ